ncbi:HesB/IscA family protein [Wolbachia endosymbiont of Pentidionis agamae]|uniref:HesB/IscA family protein n=1 Tax=Wolbachia endosymbiont of Pentidionis agamae TaxID=3110435 RepID=UPI002FD4B3A9
MSSTVLKKGPITITDKALHQIRYLLDQKKFSDASEKVIGLRISIKEKGCSGLKYHIEYAYDVRLFESVIEVIGNKNYKIKILIDPKSIMFLLGSKMDYVEEKFSSGFVFNNPNEGGRCGCGESFTLRTDGASENSE